MCSSSSPWTGIGSPYCSFLAARFSPCMSFPFSQACSPMPIAATMLALCAFFCFFIWACPPSRRWSLSCLDLNPHAQSQNFFTMRMRISPSKSACAVTNFFIMRMRISPSHGCGLRSYTHAVALVLIETESSCDEGCFGPCPWPDALICCQIIVLILMVDETDPARDLIRSWWRIRTDWLMIDWWWWLWWFGKLILLTMSNKRSHKQSHKWWWWWWCWWWWWWWCWFYWQWATKGHTNNHTNDDDDDDVDDEAEIVRWRHTSPPSPCLRPGCSASRCAG